MLCLEQTSPKALQEALSWTLSNRHTPERYRTGTTLTPPFWAHVHHVAAPHLSASAQEQLYSEVRREAHCAFVRRAQHSLSLPGHILQLWLCSSLSPQSHDSSSWKSSYMGIKGTKSKCVIAQSRERMDRDPGLTFFSNASSTVAMQ